MKQAYQIFLIALSALYLIGCSSIPTQPTSVEWQAHQAELSKITHYKANGKLGYIGKDQRQSFNFQWQHSEQLSQLRLTTFLGQTVLNLTVTPNGAKVVTYDDQTFTDTNAAVLIKNLTGLVIPIDNLPQWLLGLPANASTYQLNESNTLASLTEQLNNQLWLLTYSNYRLESFSQGMLPLPRKLQLTQPDTTLNIVISKWTLPQ
ncbi:lipoprotein localization factor LolB [Vibrio sp. 10N.286.49.B3]|uniref:lipoprotein insertase outer membrane protein LolB n=1 Tax=Vibrio sp. 10N.286.49.B3 TaxID=1880855 RepID=UPI000C8529C2|nr:lipoprotein insertase outer membrane protein LolB [Vibrio sp. 10N.286.49.B3]PMH41799.1 lipoprotein localization factor LolB [Vibrio sp. 10N.286.49.B3]